MDLLAHLEAYVATVDEANFSRAADRMGIAQPLLSRRIKTLEEHFGGLLFDRSRRQVSTTELGLLLLPYARDVLDRAQRLRQAARSARQARVRVVGVPADCVPAALARVIRAGAEHGVTLAVSELPPLERDLGLADGSLGYALRRVPPAEAAFRVPLGLASAPPPDGPVTRRTAGRSARGRALRLEDLRPRRSGPTTGPRPGTAPAPLPILILEEDEVPYARDGLAHALARAGLPEGLARTTGSPAAALTETLAGQAMLLCAEPFARQHGADWVRLGDVSLHRGYEVGATARLSGSGTAAAPDWLVASLTAAAGVAAAAPGTRRPEDAVGDVPARLAARG